MEDRNNGFSLCRAKVKRTGQTAQIQNGLDWRPKLRYQQRYQASKNCAINGAIKPSSFPWGPTGTRAASHANAVAHHCPIPSLPLPVTQVRWPAAPELLVLTAVRSEITRRLTTSGLIAVRSRYVAAHGLDEAV